MIARRKLTTHLQEALEAELVVGLAASPAAGGWDGTPNDDGTNYVPYAVLIPQPSTPANPNPLPGVTEWRLNYALSCYGASPEQPEWVADTARELLDALTNTNVTLGDGEYRIQQVYPSTIGGVLRVDATDPPTWGQTDTYTVWLSKES